MPTLKNLLKSALPEGLLTHLLALDHYLNGEPEVRLMSQLVARGRDAIDAGANIGTYAYFFRRHARHVYAYEPNPGLAATLQRRLPGVQVRNLALSDTEGEVVLQVPIDAQGRQRHELASIAQDFSGGPRETFKVRMVTIDSENFDNIGFLKVDVEQHERQVLRGALQTIRRCRPVIMTECTPLKYEADLKTVFSFILQENYVGWCSFAGAWLPFEKLTPAHLDPARFGTPGGFIGNNILFFPAEHPLSQTGPAV